MTDHDNRAEWTDVHALSGAYAVDAVDDIEKARFEEHLRRCPECRAEVDSLREAAAALAVDPVDPPAALRVDVLAGIEAIRPLPPLTPQVQSAATTASRRWRTAPLLVAAAFVLIALVATALVRPWQGTDQSLSAADRVIHAADVRSYDQRFPDDSHATVYVSPSEGRAVVRTSDMALAPAGKVYELWLQHPDGHMSPAGLMPDDPDATVLLDGDAAGATGVGITIEPDGGSAQPTTDPILLLDVTA